jgi:hypothetical protein
MDFLYYFGFMLLAGSTLNFVLASILKLLKYMPITRGCLGISRAYWLQGISLAAILLDKR